MAKKGILQWDLRDVSSGIKKIREFLLGRKYVFHNRFHPLISPRSIPPPDVPRGPEYKYSDQWYGKRDVLGSVKPPVVAPIAEGVRKPAKKSTLCAPKKDSVSFICPPTPGMPWWFDGHCYYEIVPAGKCGTSNPCQPPPAKKCPPTKCPQQKPPPPCPPPPPPCDPCQKPVGPPEPPCNPCKKPKTCN